MNDEEINNDNSDIKITQEESFDMTEEDSLESDLEFVDSTEDGEALPTKDIVKKLREDIKTLRKEKEEYLTGWQRAKADYVNLQKDLDNVRINSGVYAKESMAEKLFPALDSFDMAIGDKTHWQKIDKDWQDGILSIYNQFMSGLSKAGIEKIDKDAIPFDPNLHQSINLVETDDESKDHTVASILQIGYKIGERVIRPAKVNIYEYKKE